MSRKYLVTDLNDPSKFKIEYRTHAPTNLVTPLFEGQECDDPALLDIIDRQDTHMVTKIQRDEQDKPILEAFQEPVLDLEGKPVLDEEAKPVLRDNERTIPVLDKDGNPVLEERPLGAPYKVAVFNQAKYDSKIALQDARKALEAADQEKRDIRKARLTEAHLQFDTLTEEARTQLLKDLLEEGLGL